MPDSREKPLFPVYLNQGSRGGAVDFLHRLLYAFGFGDGIIADLEYGHMTYIRVQALQSWLEMDVVDEDGHFGPRTRAALYHKTGLSVALIPWNPKDGLTYWVGPDGKRGIWPR